MLAEADVAEDDGSSLCPPRLKSLGGVLEGQPFPNLVDPASRPLMSMPEVPRFEYVNAGSPSLRANQMCSRQTKDK